MARTERDKPVYVPRQRRPLEDAEAAGQRAKKVLGPGSKVTRINAAVRVSASAAAEWLQVTLPRPSVDVWIVRVEGDIRATGIPRGVETPSFDHMNVVLNTENGMVLATSSRRSPLKR